VSGNFKMRFDEESSKLNSAASRTRALNIQILLYTQNRPFQIRKHY
jgi:hypothetical protein